MSFGEQSKQFVSPLAKKPDSLAFVINGAMDAFSKVFLAQCAGQQEDLRSDHGMQEVSVFCVHEGSPVKWMTVQFASLRGHCNGGILAPCGGRA